MSAKEDILEQIVAEFLIHKGYFVRTNIKFVPAKTDEQYSGNKDNNHSDIDVLGYHPLINGPERVWAVSCKSWQSGFRPAMLIDAIENGKKVSGREAWKGFRELCRPQWSRAFRQAVRAATGAEQFIHVTAVTRLDGDASVWTQHAKFREAIGQEMRIVTLSDMVSQIRASLTKTLAATEVGRTLQLFQAARIE